ncbi:MAG: KpsF/GutQ family sugar-phosphate isomerase [Roseitalea porphyridii]|uniref:KpsF/GutQ family sugar-phosphate isomerase n=1 Tax=Roseitalea porphyridii TaxID=1852022 RepID=A0A4P6V584_9HYPH|nr:KpsF/GutQ family sugar-phosphate isomerase [Roseitalea porphyridii]QBK31740.1 KpsF/GutQ family sugar-phosphate isomerase [Roseitalea porphyridii]
MLTRPSAMQSALRTLGTERGGLDALSEALQNGLGKPFAEAVDTLHGVGGRVIVSGVGKSGHIARKIAATLASTGTPAYFVHAAEANHGDLGMITRQDAIICLSWSGEAQELGGVISYAKRFSIPLIAITAGATSALAREASIVLLLPRAEEACPHGLAPTTSSVMQLAIGDALAVALLETRGFTADDFRDFHPGGKLGASLTRVGDIMHTGERIPLVPAGASMRDAIVRISQKGFGCVGIVREDGRLAGIITDGDLRRHMQSDLLAMRVDDVMTSTPKTITADALAATALTIVNDAAITALMIVEDDRPVGIVHLHDLLRVGVA